MGNVLAELCYITLHTCSPLQISTKFDVLLLLFNSERDQINVYCARTVDGAGHQTWPSQGPGQLDGGSASSDIKIERRILFCDDPRVTEDFVKKVVAENKAEESLAALRSLSLTEHLLCCAIQAFADKGSAKGVSAVERLGHDSGLLGHGSNARLLFAMIQAYGSLERLDDVRRVFKGARRIGAWQGSQTDTRNTTIYLNALHTDPKLVFVRAKQMLDSGVAFETATFNVLLKACMRAPDGHRARLAWEWMIATGLEPDDITYVSLIKALSYSKDFEGVLGVRETMIQRNFTPTANCWGALLVACGVAHQVEMAHMLWRELKAEMGGPAAVPPNLYDAMLTACNTARQGERSLSVLAEMKKAGVTPGVKTYNLGMKACEGDPGQRARPEQFFTALSLFSEMKASGLEPDAFTYGILFELCAEAGQGRVAAQLQDQMIQDGVKSNAVVWTSLLKALARGGMVDEALTAFRRMVWGPARLKPNRITFRTLVRELREQGALAAALRVYTGMRRAQFAPNSRDFQELIAAAAESALADGDPELQAQLAALCNISSLTEIDLHGMSKHEARAAVLCVLSMLVSEHQRGARHPAPLTIITGQGGHSAGRAAVLPKAVRQLLEELHIPLPGSPGALSDNVHSNGWYGDDRGGDGVNPGRIVVGSEQLVMWLKARSAARPTVCDRTPA